MNLNTDLITACFITSLFLPMVENEDAGLSVFEASRINYEV